MKNLKVLIDEHSGLIFTLILIGILSFIPTAIRFINNKHVEELKNDLRSQKCVIVTSGNIELANSVIALDEYDFEISGDLVKICNR